MGVEGTYRPEREEEATRDCDMKQHFKDFASRSTDEHRFHRHSRWNPYLQLRIINAHLACSLYPSCHNPSKITERTLLAFAYMVYPSSNLHLGTLLDTSFARAMGGSRRYVMSLGTYITHSTSRFNVNLEGCMKEGNSLGFGEDTLSSMHLFRVFGPHQFIEGMSLPPEVPPPVQPPDRALSRRRRVAPSRPAPPPPTTTSSSGATPSTYRDHLVERMDLLESRDSRCGSHHLAHRFGRKDGSTPGCPSGR
ncbi:unnamed protein product [Linum trigynum]|uniref:Uncharacterized protein n=1 Tax=Linum trigynum TaxID=586398 RepID=A0AAV2FTX3_9ROSI